MTTPENQSYLSAGINKLSAWTPRATTPKPTSAIGGDLANPGLKETKGGDHKIGHRRGPSLQNYPRDCPPLTVQWFHAVDIPKRKPNLAGGPATEKPSVPPKKYAAFSKNDSRAIETAFQRWSRERDTRERKPVVRNNETDLGAPDKEHGAEAGLASRNEDDRAYKVPVNEDFLFDVDIEERELAPAYWLGPVYEVRRGTWFQQDGSVQKPCDENLAIQLEEGFLKTTPWRLPQQRSASQPRTRTASISAGSDTSKGDLSVPQVTAKVSSPDLRKQSKESEAKPPDPANAVTHRLFGPYSNSVVTYQDATTAWILTDDFLSRMSSTVYQRFAGGSHFAGIKVTRGYLDPAKRDAKTDARSSSKDRAKDPEKEKERDENALDENSEEQQPVSEVKRRKLERHMSSLVAAVAPQNKEQQEEEVRKRDEQEIQDDYQDQEGEEQNREIEHLLLVTHGIGQRLGLRMETVNFIHDVNSFRKTLKSVYSHAPDLQALNMEVEKLPKNCRIQVLPINWRHKLDFPKQSLRHNREKKERDLGDTGFGEDDEYPNLEDLTIEGVPAVRNLITDLALDILLYTSPVYKDHITRIVVEECNKTYNLFKRRSPNFKGKISLVGHSLGSAIFFDIMCAQKDTKAARKISNAAHKTDERFKLDFDVEDFYALGSPIGLFQMLAGKKIAARPTQAASNNLVHQSASETLLGAAATTKVSEEDAVADVTTSTPKCRQIYNIFHPTDPISYRMEPLISPAMSSLKPQPLPYTKRGIFGAPVGQGLSGIGSRVGQSVSGLWSSFSTGIASSLLNRSLGISAEDETKLNDKNAVSSKSSRPLSMVTNNNASSTTLAGTPVTAADAQQQTEDLRRQLTQGSIKQGEDGQHPPTLIDNELQTLYAGFEKRRISAQSDGSIRDLGEQAEWEESSERAKKLRNEESKVRALNVNGRVDYSIQE
ncbi:hypothetical protein MBLNU457_7447t2 [Dothideomycetes sp. NU457]